METLCGDSYNEKAYISLYTDMPAHVTLVCSNGDYTMNKSALVPHVIEAHYGADDEGCIFFVGV